MNDDDYMAVLREELDEIIIELNEVRAHRDKQKRLIEVLEEERKALQMQKEERVKRSEILLRTDNLQVKYDAKKEERNKAFDEVSDAVKSCNRMLIATGRPPLNLPVYGKYEPRVEHRHRKKEGNEPLPLAAATAASLVVKSVDPLGMPSFHPSREIGRGNSVRTVDSTATGSSNVVVSGILRKGDDASRAKPKKPVKGRKKRTSASSKCKKVRVVKLTESSTATPDATNEDRPNDTTNAKPQSSRSHLKPVKEDSQGDMTDFLDAIGYYSPEEDDNDDDNNNN